MNFQLKPFFLVLLAAFFPVSVFSQTADYPSVSPDDIAECSIISSKTYTGSSLFGYIDGGAELYLEYGFSGARVDEISIAGSRFTVEIYRMTGPEEAFGVFSLSRFQCKEIPPIAEFSCHNPYQLQICSGSYYINIINETGSKADGIVSLQLGVIISKKISEKSADLSMFFTDSDSTRINREALLLKGSTAVMNAVPDLAELFGNATGYVAVVLKEEEVTLISIRFLSKELMAKFMTDHHWDLEKLSVVHEILTPEGTLSKTGKLQILLKSKV